MPRIYRYVPMTMYPPMGKPGGPGNAGSSGTMGTPSEEILADSPIRFYKLDEASGNAIDYGSEGVDATTHGGITYSQTSLIPNTTDTCMLFNGTTGYFDALQSVWTNDVTLEAVIKIAAPPAATSIIFEQYDSAVGLLYFIDTSGRLHLDGKSDATYRANFTTASVADNNAHHVVATITSNTVALYVDGVAVAMTNTDFNGSTYRATQIAFGAQKIQANPASLFFGGYIQYMTQYDKALSAARILTHAQSMGFA